MKFQITFVLISLVFICSAEPYAKIEDQHTDEGCTYYDVVIYDDNGTDDDADDTRIGGGTIRDCDRVHGDSPSVNPVIINIQMDPDTGCRYYLVEIGTAGGDVIGTGGAAEDGCP